jgi:hypothetical protein
MQLLVTVEERQSRVIGEEIKFQLLEASEHHHIF